MAETGAAQALVWLGILLCISQSAMFSGLNLALLGISRLRLEVEAASGNTAALEVLRLRMDFNFLLTTILWGNVSVNVLLALLSDSVMAGMTAFLFSTVLITFAGEIAPQAYFSRHALEIGSRLAPLVRVYQWILYPVAKPTAKILDWWLGAEGIRYFREEGLRTVIKWHIDAAASDVGQLEGLGALNFLALDDLFVSEEGETISDESIIQLPFRDGRPVFPDYSRSPDDPFLGAAHRAGRKWLILVDQDGMPRLVMNANAFLRDAMFSGQQIKPLAYCHAPVIVRTSDTLLGQVLSRLKVQQENDNDDVVDYDVILWWGEGRKIITGSDILGRLMRGIAQRESADAMG